MNLFEPLRRLSVVAVACVAGLLIAGCASDRGANVPASAEMVASGNGDLSAVAPHDGMVYLYDKDGDRLVYSGHIAKGQNFEVDRSNDRLLIDGKVVQEKTADIDHQHRILFDADTRPATNY